MKNLCNPAFAILALAAAAGAQPSGQTVLVWSFGFSPQPIRLVAGRPVTLTFVNRSRSSHDFTAQQFFGNSTIVTGDVRGGEVELGPGESKSVTLIPRPGTYHAHCSHFLHKQFGMHDEIVVQ